ncbi:Sulfatase-modifying factor enzyme 1 [Daejeonella rubra]|uniref:Sulfatase-modifying factor enzyme 1 n=1 Tax=Daejeonella rubra TaxID=990371 RepID=A0A1G9NEK5_9SPHI|nr:SUMF1/EgtB/PvdO family nonheme iron enzyme [Daejeonella rubra]SDL84912.1 Sulfatase-modifying factor enzyme 1 [Daejeonella rubra]
MQKYVRSIFLFLLLIACGQTTFANNIRIKKLSLTDTLKTTKDVKIKFDLSWENSWRDDINWDAAWITAKVKRANGSWKHIKFQTTGNSIDGNPQTAKIVVPPDRMGAFIYRSGKGTGNIDLSGIKLAWNYGIDSVANIDSAEIRFFATEMVYVPQGSFAFGDSYTPTKDIYSQASADRLVPSIFKNFIAADTSKFGRNTAMFSIISDKTTPKLTVASTNSSPYNTGDQIIIDGIYLNGTKGIGITNTEPFKYSGFPIGYKAFYAMKYEVSQGQYTDFLNTTKVTITPGSPPGMTSNLFPLPNSPSQPLVRFSIEKQGETYIVSRPDRAMDHTTSNQVFAFANWSSLRPMTELEFEKAARGPLAPTYNDRANGQSPQGNMPPMGNNDLLINVLKLNGAENGTEAPTTSDSTKFLAYNGSTIEGGDGGSGSYRVGVFATSSSSRRSSGASYYGIMGLSDNVSELVITLNTENSRSFKDVNGIGENSLTGYPILSHWFSSNFFDSWSSANNKNSWSGISGRANGSQNGGFRLVRSAPSDN